MHVQGGASAEALSLPAPYDDSSQAFDQGRLNSWGPDIPFKVSFTSVFPRGELRQRAKSDGSSLASPCALRFEKGGRKY